MKLELLNKIQLDEFVAKQPHSQFLQSWDWGEFQRAVGHGVWHVGVFDEQNQLLASAQIIQHKLPFKKSYLYCPRGPVFSENLTEEKQREALKLILSKARDITILTSQTEEIFFRLEPTFDFRSSVFGLRSSKSIQPLNTLILNLTQSEAQLLESMRPKTRYNIKVAERHNVSIVEEKNFAAVWPLFLKTSQRDKFGIHSKNYYQKMLETIPWIKLWTAIYKNQIIAAAIIGYFGDTATYIHGASDYNFRQLMVPYLLHWEIIKHIKQNHAPMLQCSNAPMIKYYDFYGIAPTDDSSHPWSGITRFKKGFGGQAVNYPGTFDFVYQNNSYRLYKILRKFNRWLRGA